MIADRVAAVRDRIARAAARAGRAAAEVTLVAVSKTHPPERVREALAAGLQDFGENRVQEAEAKVAALQGVREKVRWHLVGHLQGNKARAAAALFDRVHSVDGLKLAQRLERAAEEARKTLPVLVQVRLGDEETKSGCEPDRLFGLLDSIRGFKRVHADGLMVIPPFLADPEAARPFFARLRKLRDEALRRGLLRGRELSMGMSHDLEAAVEEGATMVRVGTAIFGERTVVHS